MNVHNHKPDGPTADLSWFNLRQLTRTKRDMQNNKNRTSQSKDNNR